MVRRLVICSSDMYKSGYVTRGTRAPHPALVQGSLAVERS